MKPSRTCRALTLIEVLAATVLLGTLLVGLVLARGRHTRQLRESAMVIRAASAADEWLSAQWVDTGGFPRNGEGPLSNDGRLWWRTYPVDNAELASWGAVCVRLEVSETASSEDEPLIAIDLALPSDQSRDAASIEQELRR